ncbi:hypothetical protein JCM11641_003544 [Rhodosporidiobolus odoratus]
MPPSPEGREVDGLAYYSTLERPLLQLGWKNFGRGTELAKLAQAWTDWRKEFWRQLPEEDWATWPLDLQQEAKAEVNVLVTAFKSEKAKWKRAEDLTDLEIGLRVYRSHAVNAAIASLQARVNPEKKQQHGFSEWRVGLLRELQPWMYTQDQSIGRNRIRYFSIASGMHSLSGNGIKDYKQLWQVQAPAKPISTLRVTQDDLVSKDRINGM